MAKLLVIVLLMILSFSYQVEALNTPEVGRGGGAITFFFTSGVNFAGGIEYGLNQHLAAFFDYNAPFSRLGVKYQFQPKMALLAGINLQGQPYLGFNTSFWLINRLEGIFDVNVLLRKTLKIPYEAGVRFVIGSGWDLRTGLFGSISSGQITAPAFKIGLGYRY